VCVGVRKEENSFSGYAQLSRCLEARFKQIWLDDNDRCLTASQVVGEFECSVARVTASVNTTETDYAVYQHRVVDRVECQDADTVAIFQAKLAETRCKLPDCFSALPCSPVSLSIERVDVHWLILIKSWRVKVPR
jgi:hypothetical protein